MYGNWRVFWKIGPIIVYWAGTSAQQTKFSAWELKLNFVTSSSQFAI